jgi:hypothetical protein
MPESRRLLIRTARFQAMPTAESVPGVLIYADSRDFVSSVFRLPIPERVTELCFLAHGMMNSLWSLRNKG